MEEIKLLKSTLSFQDSELIETRTKLNDIYNEYHEFQTKISLKEDQFNEILNEVYNKLIFVQKKGDELRLSNEELVKVNHTNQEA